MSTELPFDPRPRPDEVARVLQRVQRRRAWRAGGSGAAAFALVAAAVVTLGGGPQVLVQEKPPLVPADGASPSAAPVALPAPPLTAPLASALPGVAGPAVPGRSPLPLAQPRRTPTPRPGDQARPAPAPAPPKERPVYSGQIGPGYGQFEATDCVVVNRSSSDGVIRNDYCRYFIGGGKKDAWQPRIRICRVYDSTTPGRLTFPGAEEADFALYRGTQGEQGAVPTQLLYRFSNTVRYEGGAHGRDVAQGDCWTWRISIPIDFEAYPADAGFVGEWRTKAEQVTTNERVQRLHFTAGAFHGDETSG